MKTAQLACVGGLCLLLAGSDCGPDPVVREEIVFGDVTAWPTPVDFAGLASGQLVVTNTLEDTLSVVDPEDGSELFRAPLGLFPMQAEGPHHLALTPDGAHVLVPLSNDVPGAGGGPHGSHGNGTLPGALLKLNARTLLLEGTSRLDRSPGDILLNSAGTTVYVSHYDVRRVLDALAHGLLQMDSTVAVVDVATMERRHNIPVCPTAHGLAFNSAQTRLYTTCALSDEIAQLDLTVDPPTVTRIPVDQQAAVPPAAIHEPYALTEHAPSGKLWVSNLRSKSLRIYDPATSSWQAGPTFSASPMFGAFVNDQQFLVPIRETAELALVDVDSLQLVRPSIMLDPSSCLNAHVAELSPDKQTAWMVCEGDRQSPGTLVIVDLAPFAVRTVALLGLFPDSVRLVP